MKKAFVCQEEFDQHLKSMNIETIGQLAALPLEKLLEYFGNSYGQYLYEAARGIDESPLVTRWEPKSFSRETTFHLFRLMVVLLFRTAVRFYSPA
jgi:DNA polymerase IV